MCQRMSFPHEHDNWVVCNPCKNEHREAIMNKPDAVTGITTPTTPKSIRTRPPTVVLEWAMLCKGFCTTCAKWHEIGNMGNGIGWKCKPCYENIPMVRAAIEDKTIVPNNIPPIVDKPTEPVVEKTKLAVVSEISNGHAPAPRDYRLPPIAPIEDTNGN